MIPYFLLLEPVVSGFVAVLSSLFFIIVVPNRFFSKEIYHSTAHLYIKLTI
jgi:hypothetical protein